MAEDVIISIGAKTEAFNKAVDQIQAKTEGLEDALAGIATTSGAIFAGLVAGAGAALAAFADAEKATIQLTTALQNQGIFTQKLAQQYDDLSEAIQNKTGIDDDSIKKGFAVLQNFIGQREVTPELANAIADLSTKTGDYASAAEIVGKAVQGNVRGLKQYGIEVDANATQSERLRQAVEGVNGAFGGQAEALGRSVGGSLARMRAALGDVLEVIGERLAPAFKEISDRVVDFLTRIKNNKPLQDFVITAGRIALEVTGLITALAGGALAIVKISQAIRIAKTAMDILGISVRGLVGATGIGLLLIVATEIYIHWNEIWPRMQAVFKAFVDNITPLLVGLGKLLIGVFTFNGAAIKQGFAEVKDAISRFATDASSGLKKVSDAEDAAAKKEQETFDGRIKARQDFNKKRQAEQDREDQLNRESVTSQNEAVRLELEQASSERIALEKEEKDTLDKLADEKYASQHDKLQQHLENIRALQAEQDEIDKERVSTLENEFLANNEEFQALSEAQQEDFRQRKQGAVLSQIDNEKTVRTKAFNDRLSEQIKENNRYLEDQRKFGTTYAELNKIIYNSQVQSAANSFGELTKLQSSNNSTLKTIGKAAAVTQITLDTAKSAMSIYAGFATIPIIGPILGVAGAAAAVAFGAEQIGKVVSAQRGGIVPGFNRGFDEVPALLQPGELVVPTNNFNEVISAVAAQRAAVATAGGDAGAIEAVSGGGSEPAAIVIGFDGPEAEKVLTQRRTEASALGTLRERTV